LLWLAGFMVAIFIALKFELQDWIGSESHRWQPLPPSFFLHGCEEGLKVDDQQPQQ